MKIINIILALLLIGASPVIFADHGKGQQKHHGHAYGHYKHHHGHAYGHHKHRGHHRHHRHHGYYRY